MRSASTSVPTTTVSRPSGLEDHARKPRTAASLPSDGATFMNTAISDRPETGMPVVTDHEWALLMMHLEERIADEAASARMRHPARIQSRAW